MKVMWVVTVVDTQNDYKCRGGWSEARKPKLFTSKEAVDEYLLHFHLNYIHSNADEYCFEEGGKLDDYRKYFTRAHRVKREFRRSLEDLQALTRILAEGEYVPSMMDISVDEVVADEEIPAPSDSGDECDDCK